MLAIAERLILCCANECEIPVRRQRIFLFFVRNENESLENNNLVEGELMYENVFHHKQGKEFGYLATLFDVFIYFSFDCPHSFFCVESLECSIRNSALQL